MNCFRSVAAVLILLLGFSSVQAAVLKGGWNYTNQEAWKNVAGWDCDGMRQSPINININNLVGNSRLIDLRVTNFDQSFNGNFSNDGYLIRFDPEASSPTAQFINHVGTYQLLQFHFHWGPRSTMGSEHTINGQTYGGELHFVTRKTTGPSTAGDAFAVLGVLLESDSSLAATGSWRELLDNIPTNNGQTTVVNGLILNDFLPTDLSYYYYEGSLTTPECSEVVQWFLLRNPVNVPATFLNALRTTVNGINEQLIVTNFRMPQPLNGRQVMIQDEDSGKATLRYNGGLLLLITLIICLLYL